MTARWITAALLLLATPVVGQEQEPVLEPGVRVRVSAPSVHPEHRLVGTYWGVRDDGSLMVTAEETEEVLSVPLARIESLETWREAKDMARLGFLIGAGIGAVGGAVWGVNWCRDAYEGGTFFFSETDCKEEGAALLFGLAGAGVVGLLGYGVGALASHPARWELTELPPAKPMVAVHATGRFTLGVSIPLRR